ncbi:MULTISPECIES: hypothetical protein [Pseudanabaena]|uniref:Uncharacterized protein n=1 Tax=Pseudanabaena catenata USMAC16 TaxID=1855837 RepID=A0A9X4MJT9_9CYAN|nr:MULTISPECIES: hypothetical protein [Pseudanabaena]MDG3497259.1 hypothetical protein [Pseudanabaena catenata USMAC16]
MVKTAIAPHTHKPDRLFSQIKQRSPLTTHKTRSPILCKSTSDRPSPPTKPDRPFSQIKQRSPHSPTTNPIA